MLLGIGAVLTGGTLTIHDLLLQRSGLPTQSSLTVALIHAGFAVVVLGFLYGVVTDAVATTDDSD